MAAVRRALRIVATMLRHRIDLIALDLLIALDPAPERWQRIARYSPLRLLPKPRQPAAVRMRLALEQLGPVFVKLGQLLSTRRDLLPADYAEELAKLQDAVPPFPTTTAIRIIERTLGAPLATHFARFDAQPLAAASVAQVHSAQLHDGSEVVVKVLRPGLAPVIRADLALLLSLATRLAALGGDFARLRPVEIVHDYRRTLLGELDLAAEATNTRQLRANFRHSEQLYVPRVYDTLSTAEVLTLERLYGIGVGDVAGLRAAGVDMQVLAARGVEIFFTQVFMDNFFHADMHPGNILVDVREPSLPRYMAIDCAIMGRLSNEDQDYLARNLLAFFNRDYAAVVRLHIDSGWVPPDTDAREFERVIRDVCDPVFARPLEEISFGNFLVALFRTARQFDMQVQPQLVLLQKTLLEIEGVGRQLYPQLDLWTTAKPFMERWLRARYRPARIVEGLLAGGIDNLLALPLWPAKVNEQLRGSRHALAVQADQLLALQRTLDTAARRARRGRRLAAVLVLAALAGWALGVLPDQGTGVATAAAAAVLLWFW